MTNRILVLFALVASISIQTSSSANDRLTFTQWVSPTVPGVFKAQVTIPLADGKRAPVAGATVLLRGRGGIVHEGKSDQEGHVEIPRVASGVYGMLTYARGICACYAVHVVNRDVTNNGFLPSEIIISCALEPVQTFIKEVDPYLPSDDSLDNLYVIQENVGKIARKAVEENQYHVAQSSDDMVGYVFQPTDHGLALDPEDEDDELDPAEDAVVYLYQNGKRLGKAETDKNGRFEFEDVTPGVYTLMTAGGGGIGVFGIFFETSADLTQITSDGYRYVVQNGGEANAIGIQTVPLSSDQVAADTANAPGVLAAPIASAFGGGGASVAGGTGGGLGIGATTALGGAVAAAQDDEFPTTPNATPDSGN